MMIALAILMGVWFGLQFGLKVGPNIGASVARIQRKRGKIADKAWEKALDDYQAYGLLWTAIVTGVICCSIFCYVVMKG